MEVAGCCRVLGLKILCVFPRGGAVRGVPEEGGRGGVVGVGEFDLSCTYGLF